MNDKNILTRFLEMSLGGTKEVFEIFSNIPGASIYGNGFEKFLFIRGSRKNRVLLVAHADTYWDNVYNDCTEDKRFNCAAQKIYEDNGIIRNGNGGLGADDRAGCAIVWLLKDLGHSILITGGEECGNLGSRY